MYNIFIARISSTDPAVGDYPVFFLLFTRCNLLDIFKHLTPDKQGLHAIYINLVQHTKEESLCS